MDLEGMAYTYPLIVEARQDSKGKARKDKTESKRLVELVKFGQLLDSNENCANGDQEHEAKDHEGGVRSSLPVEIARRTAVERRAFSHGVLGEDRQIGPALRSLHIDGKGAMFAVHLEVRIHLVVAEAFFASQSVNGLLVGRRHIDVALGSAAGWPASAVLVADGIEGHEAILNAGAVEDVKLEVGIVFGLVVSVC